MAYFNHISVGDAVKQVSFTNCGNTAEVVVDFLRTGKLRVAEPSMKQSFEEISAKFGGGSFQPATIPRMKELMKEGEIVVVYGVTDLSKSPMSVDGHYFVGMKKKGELHLFDGQTGEHAVFALNDNNFSKFLQSKYNKTYKQANGGGFKYLKVR